MQKVHSKQAKNDKKDPKDKKAEDEPHDFEFEEESEVDVNDLICFDELEYKLLSPI